MVVACVLTVVLVMVAYSSLVRLYKPFGGRPDREAMELSPNYHKRTFQNQVETSMAGSLRDTVSIIRDMLRRHTHRRPRNMLKTEHPSVKMLQAKGAELVWLGHSSLLLRLHEKTILLDPVVSTRPSPFQWLGPKRFSRLPVSLTELGHINAVLISHDHYDHLDYKAIRQLRNHVDMFFVPLGVGAHLRRWGVAETAITEMDWWDEVLLDGLKLACTPSRHFSGRSLTDRFATLWCSWVIDAGNSRLYFSGDTGYGPHFKDIGDKYGPFDLTMMECGQYDRRWSAIHMLPEETLQATLDLRGKRVLPIHWGAFVLALHAWTEPPERLRKVAKKFNLPVVTPKLGEVIKLSGSLPHETWWKGIA